MTDNSKHTPFLQQVARHYSQINADINDYCFVFPNRRSSQFFIKYFNEELTKTNFLPNVSTISDFIADFSNEILGTPVELIFSLYKSYCKVAKRPDYEFDRFVYWGNVVLKDFNDVDLYLVDAKQVFTNAAELKEIATDYFTPELKKAIEHYLNVHFDETDDINGRFWKHYTESVETEGNDEVKEKYKSMWELLFPLYKEFNNTIKEEGLTYNGKMSKEAAMRIKIMGVDDFDYKKYVFVGFNVLSNSEFEIFKGLQTKGMAEFCWDFASPAFRNKSNKGTKFLQTYVKTFPSSFQLEKEEDFPANLNVIGIPSYVGQAQYAFKVVDDLIDKGIIKDVTDAVDTAIVLPDEKLFTNLLNAVTPKIKNANATLGYPLRSSDVASLLRVVSKMHRHASRSMEENEFRYFRDFVKEVLSHPIIRSLYNELCTQLISRIDNENIFNVPESMFLGTKLENLFITIKNTEDTAEVLQYIDRIISFCNELGRLQTNLVDDNENTMSLQYAFTLQYIDVLNDVKSLITKRGVPMCETTVFYLLDRLVSLYTIPFQGEPLNGLQMMGVLETRDLDFKNLIMLSMNERVFPRKFFSGSFIPTNLRRFFKMSTIDQQESMTAYYFYRLLARAENVYLIYDSSTQAIGSGEYSRFITQLDRIYHCNIKFSLPRMNIKPTSSVTLNVAKVGKIRDKIEAYRTPDSKRYLSASSIKEYIHCPIKFYLHHIEGVTDNNPSSDFMDAGTFGTIIHDTLQQLYYPKEYEKSLKHNLVTKSAIKYFRDHQLEKFLVRNVNKIYLHKDNLDDPLFGETSITFEAMKLYAEGVLNYDMNLLDNDNDFIEIYECEKSEKLTLRLSETATFNFTYKADRIDRINGKGPIRIVDYKTGKDETAAKKISNLINPDEHHCHSILQLMIYCNAYAQLHPEEKGEIQPIIYKLRKMDESGISIDGVKITDFRGQLSDAKGRPYMPNEKFIEIMEELMSGLFDYDKPFEQRKEDKSEFSQCSYCNFIEFCRR